MKLFKVLAEKKDGRQIHIIGAEATIREAAKKMTDLGVGALLVVEDESKPESYVGILTERSIIRNCWKYDIVLNKKVKELMSPKLLVATGDDEVDQIMDIIAQTKMRYVPVWDQEKIIGIVSVSDIINALHEEKEKKIKDLSRLSGTYGNKVY